MFLNIGDPVLDGLKGSHKDTSPILRNTELAIWIAGVENRDQLLIEAREAKARGEPVVRGGGGGERVPFETFIC